MLYFELLKMTKMTKTVKIITLNFFVINGLNILLLQDINDHQTI